MKAMRTPLLRRLRQWRATCPPMRVLSLFTGIGGIDLACEWAGMRIVGQVEIDEYCHTLLGERWPLVKRFRDVREVTGHEFGTVDVIVGGFPCQPTSNAGKRRGTADDRWLWPEFLRLIRSIQPTWVFAENVPGLITLGLDGVLSDLALAGYEAEAIVLPAAAVGAPHIRERVFIIARRMGHVAGGRLRCGGASRGDGQPTRAGENVADAHGGYRERPQQALRAGRDPINHGSSHRVAYADRQQCEGLRAARRWHALSQSHGQPPTGGCGAPLAHTSGGGWAARECAVCARQSNTEGRSSVAHANGQRRQWRGAAWGWRAGSAHSPVAHTLRGRRKRGQGGAPGRDEYAQERCRCETAAFFEAAGEGTGSGVVLPRGARSQRRRAARPAGHTGGAGEGWQTESRLGGTVDGLSIGLDVAGRIAAFPWPALPHQPQHEWEAPRATYGRERYRRQRLTALGNSVVPLQVYPPLAWIAAMWKAAWDGEA